jgi:hypothetical protein
MIGVGMMEYGAGIQNPKILKLKTKYLKLGFLLLYLIISISTVDAKNLGKYIAKHIGKQLGKKIVKDVRHDRNQIKKEVCKLFKELIIKKKIIREDLELLKEFVDGGLPKNWKPDKKYKNITEEVGYKLIDPALTYNDYKYLKDLLNQIWNTRPNKLDLWSQIRSFRIGVFPVPNIAL